MTRRVLIAESSTTLQALVRVTLDADGFDVECVGDGRSALASIQSQAPALVICDASLHGIDGYSLVEAIRGQDATRDLPVLLLASDHHRPDVDRLDHLGIQDLLTKPFEQHDLLERVRGLLGRRQESSKPSPPQPASPPPASAREPERAAHEEPPWERPVSVYGTDSPSMDAGARRAIQDWLRGEGRPVLEAALQEVIWKVVPELAEARIRDEIRRLTEAEEDVADVEDDSEDERT